MNEVLTHDRKKSWFIWGMVFSFALSIPFIAGVANAFRGISAEKATGLAAVAGGVAEAYATVAVILAFALPLAAIVMLSRSLAKGHGVRSLFSLLGICWNALMLAFAGLSVWLYVTYFRH